MTDETDETYKILPSQLNESCKEEIGKGAFGIVYKGVYKSKQVAIKKINIINGEDYQTQIRKKNEIKNEIQILVKINTNQGHQNVLRFFGTAEYSGQEKGFGIVTEICDSSLEYSKELTKLQKRFTSDKSVLLDCLLQIAAGMEYLHSNNIIHRDLKPANVLYTYLPNRYTFTYKIADFGLARNGTEGMNKDDCYIGTPSYTAPELITYDLVDLVSMQKKPFACDVYSYGILANCLASGIKPYSNFQTQFKKTALWHAIRTHEIRPTQPTTSVINDLVKIWWAQGPSDRPDFTQITKQITTLIRPLKRPLNRLLSFI